LRRFPQGLRDRLLMNTVGLKPEAFKPDTAATPQTARPRT
jgi:hypothetical protein